MEYIEDDSDEYFQEYDAQFLEPVDQQDEDERVDRRAQYSSTQRELYSAENDTLAALNGVRNQDLSVHLYNAFALKNRPRKKKTEDETEEDEQDEQDEQADDDAALDERVKPKTGWKPHNAWTAWPLSADRVPDPDFVKRADPDDGDFVFRMETPYPPKIELEDNISTAVLRLAREKFYARQATVRSQHELEPPAENDGDGNDGMAIRPASRRARTRPGVKVESGGEDHVDINDQHDEDYEDDDDDEDGNVAQRPPSIRSRRNSLNPIVATDDELSYHLLRPSVQAILAKLDTTLMILHNAKECKDFCTSEPETTDAPPHPRSRSRSRNSDSATADNSQPPPKSKMGRPRNRRPARMLREAAPMEPGVQVKKKGRKAKVYPRLDGETDKAFAIRIARLQKKPIPYFSDDDSDLQRESTPAPASVPRAKAPLLHPGQAPPQRKDSNTSNLPDVAQTGEKTGRNTSRDEDRHISRVRLLDWRDTLGAAALTGFPAAALDRAAQRCADLFGQNFSLYTLPEESLGRTKPDELVNYEPGWAKPGFLENSGDDDNDNDTNNKNNNTSKTNTNTNNSKRPPRRLSLSRGAQANDAYFCTVTGCPRAVNPFNRLRNLERHLRLVHNYNDENDDEELPVVNSEDEKHGAVHVDGFLRPIKIRPGWATRQMQKQGKKGRTRKRARDSLGERGVGKRLRNADDDG
ncbi:RNA polymerase I-specific transcription initiation factor-domain-containing protein [Nemania sp. FL0916]|nr:RNA polymerase I-specific transcription initiation factor-domain-containing protein [Nemania sp. FL0916]